MPTTLQNLIDSVNEDVHEGSFSPTVILRYLNEAVYRECASKLQLPGLAQTSSITTDPLNEWVSMPLDYHRELQFVQSAATSMRVWVEKSFIKFMRYYPTLYNTSGSPYLTGNVERVSIRSLGGNILYYQPVPEPADTLTLYYFRLPVPMSLSNTDANGNYTDLPDGIPDEFADGVCAGYAKWKLWKKIEQDETKANNAGIYHAEFLDAWMGLKEFLGPPDEEAAYVGDELFYCTLGAPLFGPPWGA